MKRILLLMILSCMAIAGFAQGTYYWVGGATATWSSSGSWNTVLGGGGSNRATPNTGDILIFDGSNIGGGATGIITVVPNTIEVGQLRLQNNAEVNFDRTATTVGAITVTGGVTISENSKLTLAASSGTISLVLPSSAVSVVRGELNLASGLNRIYVQAASGLIFETGSVSNSSSTTNPFGSLSSGQSVDKSVVFKNGASLVYRGGNNPLVTSGTSMVVDLQKGSNLIMRAANPSSMFNGKTLPNVFVENNTVVNLVENFTSIDNLTIAAGSEFYLRSSGVSTFKGNILNNGTFGAATTLSTDGNSQIIIGSSQLLLNGTVPQTVSGNGIFKDLGALSVGSDATVTLSSSLNLAGYSNTTSLTQSTSSISGKINFINGASLTGPGRINFRTKVLQNFTIMPFSSGATTLEMVDAAQFSEAEIALGVLVSGPQIPPNTYIIGTASTAKQFTISNPVTGSGSAIAFTTKTHFSTNNPLGIDGAVQLSGTKSFGADMDYTFDAATITPFSTSNNNALGNVTFNAAAITNRSVTINGKLTLNNAILTVREGDNLNLNSASINTGTFNASSYIVTNAVGASTGVVKVADVNASTVIPVGTAAYYTPVTLNPTSISNFDINVFQGATADATPNGTALTAAQKLRMVDAVWNISRTSGTGNVDVTLSWDNALEGASFAGFGNAQIGVAAYTSGAYGTFTGTGNAAANTATIITSAFSPFVVGEANTTLPLRLLSFTAKESLNSVKLAWQTTDEVNLKEYVLQHRNANGFEKIYTVAANNKAGIFNYDYTHLNPTEGINYYRLVGVDQDGTEHPSEVRSVRVVLGNAVAVYPNPVTQNNIIVAGTVNGDVIKIINIQGQVMLTKPVSGNQLQEINVQHIQAGTYMLSIENAGKVTSTKKVIKI
ncbi:T9SS type A sorting domain-containing protein [Pedobacter nanyangensis]|uniref:T9SS type A sorting domain-containing protein n=1 Tax=Pedobacter nanyangensis TaxID=1562389 RepID=UPI000DE48255|nr:T9SS type A sorting domain-containing protein [Pedobacter nanyangensis]